MEVIAEMTINKQKVGENCKALNIFNKYFSSTQTT